MSSEVLNVLINDNNGLDKYLYVDNGVIKRTNSLKNVSQNTNISNRITQVAKVLNSELSKINMIREDQKSLINLKITEMNAKIDRHNQKLNGVGFRILRVILRESISGFFGIDLAETINFSLLKKLEMRTLRSPINDLSGASSAPLIACLQEEKEAILSSTSFVQHKDWKGRIKSTTINADLIRKSGLEPAFKVNVGSNECYLSKVFQASKIDDTDPPVYQRGAIAYVKDDNENVFKPRLVYLSGADNLWRIMPIKDGHRIGKGLESEPDKPVKASCNVPFSVSLALHWMSRQGTNETLVRYTHENSELLATIYDMLPDNTRNYLTDTNQYTLRTRNAPDDFTTSHTLESVDFINNMRPEQYPDFTSVEKYAIPGTFSDQVTVYKILSWDKQYEYIFYEAKSRDQKNAWQEDIVRPWLASVAKVNSKWDSYLTPTIACNSNSADISGSEYWNYIKGIKLPAGFKEHLHQTTPGLHDGNTVPTWEIRKHFKIIQLFEAWKNQNLSKS